MATPTYKLCIIGESGSGKTSFVHRCLGRDYVDGQPQTDGVDVNTITYAGVTFSTWDCGGASDKRGLGDAYYIGSQCCFIFATATTSFDTIKKYRKEMQQISPDVSIVVVINKCDNNKANVALANRLRHQGVKVCSISAKNGWHLTQPFALL